MIRYLAPLSIASDLFCVTYRFSPPIKAPPSWVSSSVNHSCLTDKSAAGTAKKQCSHSLQKATSLTSRYRPRAYLVMFSSCPSALTKTNSPSCNVSLGKMRLPLVNIFMISGVSAPGLNVAAVSRSTTYSVLICFSYVNARKIGTSRPNPTNQRSPQSILCNTADIYVGSP